MTIQIMQLPAKLLRNKYSNSNKIYIAKLTGQLASSACNPLKIVTRTFAAAQVQTSVQTGAAVQSQVDPAIA